MKLQIRAVRPIIAHSMPKYGSEGAAGLDLRAAFSERDIQLNPGERVMVPTGIAINLRDSGYAGIVLPRSGLGSKGLILGNSVGLIDSDYQGEIMVPLWNRNPERGESFLIRQLDRIAQLVIVPVQQVELELVSHFELSQRGDAGFGSTGVA